jgi:uncharacterized protein YciI
MFLLISRYVKPLPEVDASLPDHRAYLKGFYDKGVFLMSGPQIPRTGGVIVANAANRAEVEEIIGNDPFTLRGIARYEIVEFTTANMLPALKAILT